MIIIEVYYIPTVPRISEDPVLNNFCDQSSKLYIPGSVLMSSLSTKLKKGNKKGTCTIKTAAWTEKFRGKYFIKGTEILLAQNLKAILIRIEGDVTKNGSGDHTYAWEICFASPIRRKFKNCVTIETDGRERYKMTFRGCKIVFTKDDANFIIVTFKCCDQKIGFRPHNPHNKDIVSGVWVKVKRQKVKSIGLPYYVCNSPTRKQYSMNEIISKLNFHSRTAAMTFLGMIQQTPDDYPGAPTAKIQGTRSNLLAASKPQQRKFFREAEFLFSDHKMLRRMDSIDVVYDAIFNLSFSYAYPQDANSLSRCQYVQGLIRGLGPKMDACCSTSLTKFLDNGCDQFETT